MSRKKPLRASFVVAVTVVAAAGAALTLGCDGKAHGSDLYGGTSSGGTSGTSGTSGTYVPSGTCTSTTQYGDPCNPGESTCVTRYELLECAGGYWQPASIGEPPPPPPLCPSFEPREGDFCDSWGNECSFLDRCPDRPNGASSYHRWQCVNGSFQRQDVYIAKCPAVRPNGGESCAACAGSYPAECTYFDGSGCSPAFVSCDPRTQTWQVAISACPPPPPADAGAPGP
ncbi:MAG TPA: hypothetical protein VLT33_27610 [Labilithrix sp.]|nr:hypothetical protein [Labilithrix sp.]